MGERVLPDWAKDDQGNVVWLDDDHAVTWVMPEGETEPNGGLLWHRTLKTEYGEWCVGAFFIRPEDNPPGCELWTMEAKEPLTLSPSFLCHCGHHGFIRNGTWIGA